jgi:hypothetical protein
MIMKKESVHEFLKASLLVVFSLTALIFAFSCNDNTPVPLDNTTTVAKRLLIYSDVTSLQANRGTANILVKVYAGTDTTKTISGVEVQFSASIGTIHLENRITDAKGLARATVFGGSKAGKMGITATIENFSNTIFVSVTPGAGMVSANPSEILADGFSQSKITATVIDSLGQPTPGTLVKFITSAGTITPQSYTDDKGIAEALLRSSSSITDVSAVVTVTTEGVGKLALLAPKPAEVKVKQPDNAAKPVAISNFLGTTTVILKGITVSGSVGKTTVLANNADSTFVNIIVKETTSGDPVPNAHLTFTSSLGVFRVKEADTDNNGNAQVIFFGSNVSGTAVLTASYIPILTFTTEISLTKLLSMDLMSSPSSLPANGKDVSTIKAQITDQDGNPIQGEKVYFSTNLGTIQPYGVTDLWGNASVNLISPRQNGTAEVHAKYQSLEKITRVQFTGAEVKIQANPIILIANNSDTSTLNVSMTDASGNPVVGVVITLSTDRGTLISGDAKTTGVSITDSTSTAGKITAHLKSSEPGDAIVTVSTLGISEKITVIFTDYMFSLTSEASEIYAGGAKTLLTATLFDKNGNVTPINLSDVNFSTTLGAIVPKELTSDGRAVAELTSPKLAGTAIVTASLKIPPISSTVSVKFAAGNVGGPETIKPSYAAVVIDNGNGTFTLPISATVLDINSNFVADQTVVDFKIEPHEGVVLSPVTTVNSVATSQITYPSKSAGTVVELTAFSSGKEGKIKITLPGFVPSYLSLTAAPKSIAADGKSTCEIRATLFDNAGSILSVPDGTPVSFSTDGGTLDSEVATTINGVATVRLTSDNTPKEANVTAQSGSIKDIIKVTFEDASININQISEIVLSASQTTIEADGRSSTTITAQLKKFNGDPIDMPTTVVFGTDIGSVSKFVQSDASGNAKAQFTSGVVGTATITASVANIKGFINIIVVPGKPQSVLLGFSPTSVGVKQSGRNETLLIKADVRDNNNNPVVDNTMIKLELVGAFDTGVSITPNGNTQYESSSVPTINGSASVTFHSGTRAGTVRIKAIVVDSNPVISSETTEFMVFSGPPFLDTSNLDDPFTESHVTIASSMLNLFAGEFNTVNSKSTISVQICDRYFNPVPEGTAVYCTTTGGNIDTSTGYTNAQGIATFTLFAGNPFPTLVNSSSIENPNAALGGPARFTFPTFDYDSNGVPNNGIAFISCYTKGLDQNGRQITAWNYMPIVFSTRLNFTNGAEFSVTPGVVSLLRGQSTDIVIVIHDDNGNPVIGGSTIEISTPVMESGSTTVGKLTTTKITTNSPGQTVYSVSLTNNLNPNRYPTPDISQNTIVTVTLRSPNGDYTRHSVPIFLSVETQ